MECGVQAGEIPIHHCILDKLAALEAQEMTAFGRLNHFHHSVLLIVVYYWHQQSPRLVASDYLHSLWEICSTVKHSSN